MAPFYLPAHMRSRRKYYVDNLPKSLRDVEEIVPRRERGIFGIERIEGWIREGKCGRKHVRPNEHARPLGEGDTIA
jgi:hypothetical protein